MLQPTHASPLRIAGAAALVAALSLAGCASSDGGERVVIQQAGSSTVLPIAEAWAEAFGAENPNARFVVQGGGSGAGFKKFCRGETQVSDASRAIEPAEVSDCRARGIEPFEIQVAIDGLAVVVPKGNTFADCLTVPELNQIWTADVAKQTNSWAQVREGWPDEEIALFGPGPDSGTFDYFVEVIIDPFDPDSKGRSDYVQSEDDNVLVQGVARSEFGLGYFGLAYARENEATLNVVAIDGGDGCVGPDEGTVGDGSYAPLSRPLFMYTNGPPDGALRDYFEFGLSGEGQALVLEVGYVPLDPALRQAQLDRIGPG